MKPVLKTLEMSSTISFDRGYSKIPFLLLQILYVYTNFKMNYECINQFVK